MNSTTETKKNIFYTAMLVLTLIITIIGTVYALGILVKSQEEGTQAVYTGTLSIDYEKGREVYCSLMPIYTPEDVDTFGAYTNTFSITSDGILNSVVTIDLEINKNEFPNGYIKYALYNEQKEMLSHGNLNGTNTVNLAKNVIIKTGETATYTLQIWLEELNEDQTEYMKKYIIGKINVNAVQEKE
jgi:hypothetical protein